MSSNTVSDSASPRIPFRPDIEGLRAVAVVLVVGCHCGVPWLAGGFVGVDIFFVLSGYLIAKLLSVEFQNTKRINFREFYARRARRLLPACTLMIVTTILASASLTSPQEMSSTGHAGIAAAIYSSNVFFDHSAADYFSPSIANNPLLHTWSLGVEEQFYLLWPLLILIASRTSQRKLGVITILGVVLACSFACCLLTTSVRPTFAFYELPSRAWEFAAGGVLALLPLAERETSAQWPLPAGLAGILMILGAAIAFTGGPSFPGWIAWIPVAGTLVILFAGTGDSRSGVGAILSAGPLQYFGKRSYSWYLWHWPFIVIAGLLFPGISISGKLVAAVASLIAAELTFRYVERPFRENPNLRKRPNLSLGIASVTLLFVVAASWALVALAHQRETDKTIAFITSETGDLGDLPLKTCSSQGTSHELKTCSFGDSAWAHEVILFGDSHAMQWFDPIRTATNAMGWRLVTMLKPGCAASDINPHRVAAAVDPCKKWRENAITAIAARHPTAVLMASYDGATIRGFGSEERIAPEEIKTGTRWTLELLSEADAAIVIIRDTPLPPFDIPNCVARRQLNMLRQGETCDFDASIAINESAFAAEHAAAQGISRVYFLDLSDQICRGANCEAMQDGLLVYRDDNHLTGKFAASLEPILRKRLFGLLSGPR